MRLAFVAVLAGMLAAGAAFAEHEVFYRYTVLGYVKDDKGQPVAGRTVQVIRDKTGLAYTTQTEADGLYLVILRLGDESAGESLTLEIGSSRTPLTVRFDAKNQVDERGTRIDLEGARWHPRPAWFHSTLARVIAPPRR